MTWGYALESHFTVKEKKTYPWPCKDLPLRTFEVWPGDILTKHPNGSVTKHNGLMLVGIRVPAEDLIAVEKPVQLVI